MKNIIPDRFISFFAVLFRGFLFHFKVFLISVIVMWHVFSSLSCFSQAHTVGCEFQKVKCVHPECGSLVKKTSLPHHLKNECEFRLVTCELCHSQVVFCKLKVQCLLGVRIAGW